MNYSAVSFLLNFLPSFVFLPLLPSVCLHSNLLPPNQNLLVFRFGADCAQIGHCGPHLHNSSDGTFGNDMLLLYGAELPRTIGWGITSCFGGAFSALGFSILMMAGAGILFLFGGISHDLETNKFVEARTVFGYGVASLIGWMADVAVPEALGCRDVGCCSIRRLLQ